MEKKNKKLLIVVSILLVTIGASFAYFVTRIVLNGSGAKVEGITATIEGSTLNVVGNISFNDLNILPGHKNISSIKVTATGNNELVPYNLIWRGNNNLNTQLKYTVYKTSSNISVTTSCEKKEELENGKLLYKEECTISNIELLGSKISEGTINNIDTKVILTNDEFITSTTTGEVVYYYVILEYPNLEESQNTDLNGTFNGQVTVESSNVTPDTSILAVYVKDENGEYQATKDIPQDGYIFNTKKSVCSNGATVEWKDNKLITSNLTQSGTNCYLYFDDLCNGSKVCKTIMVNKTIEARTDFSTVLTDNTTGKIYTAEDNDGTSYYFAGAVDNNWVQFGGFYWRIIRINGDGTIRMIYNGTTTDQTGASTQINGTTYKFSHKDATSSTYVKDNAYVGYMYGTPGSNTYEATHANINSSYAKQVADEWYNTNLNKSGIREYIDTNAGFCGDRTITSGTGISSTYTEYGANNRLVTNKTPSLKCPNSNDLYTVSSSNKGNKVLTYPIGLISADEVAYAGGGYATVNQSYYLYTKQNYWTMSPDVANNNYAMIFILMSSGEVTNHTSGTYNRVYNAFGLRPVINLKSDLTFTGDGTVSNPYTIA